MQLTVALNGKRGSHEISRHDVGKTRRRKALCFMNDVHIVVLNRRYFFGRNPVDHPSELQLEDRAVEAETACVEAPDTGRSDSGAMTRQLDFLEKRGYIRRVRNESDRRSVYLMLTVAGHAVTCETLPLIVETRDRQLSGFTADEVNTLKQFIDRMIVNLS
jgi:hypothetical protein